MFFASGIQARVQAYHKKLGDLRPRYINLRDGAIDNNRFPEVEEDRFRIDASSGTSTGVEFFLKRERGKRVNWRIAYTISRAQDLVRDIVVPAHFDGNIPVDEIVDQNIPRSYDQRHAVNGEVSYAPNSSWSVGTAWQYHSGWPFTKVARILTEDPNGDAFNSFIIGSINGTRATAYHRLDVRLTRNFRFLG